jgi:Zn-dependent protease
VRVESSKALNRDTTVVVVLLGVVALVAVQRGAITSTTVLLLAVVVPSIILHEVSHGAVALLFGDDTAKRAGRLTLNPIKHIDPFGTLILPCILALSGFGVFGYAKPVPVNPRRMRHPRNDGLVVSLAGPAVNLGLALLSVVWLRVVRHPLILSTDSGPMADRAVLLFGYVNVILAVFNLIPLPPLDGSAIVERVLPREWWPGYMRLRQWAMPVLILVVLLVPGLLTKIFDPAIRLWERVLTG